MVLWRTQQLKICIRIPATTSGTGFHWQASQSTSLMNIVVQMSTASDTAHQGAKLSAVPGVSFILNMARGRYFHGKWKVRWSGTWMWRACAECRP